MGCGLEEFVLFVALGGGASGHVGFAAAFATGEGGEFADELAGAVAGVVAVFAAEGSEVELAAVVDDEEGGVGEVKLLEAVHEFLQEVGGAFEGVDDVAGEASVFSEVGEEGVGGAGGSGGLCFLEGFLGFDGGGFGGSEGGAEEGEGLVGGTSTPATGSWSSALRASLAAVSFSLACLISLLSASICSRMNLCAAGPTAASMRRTPEAIASSF